MALRKDVKGLGMPWEDQYGYVQAVKVDNTIYVSGQLSHDDQGNMVGAAPLDDSGKIRDHSKMETQMRQTYANAKIYVIDVAEGEKIPRKGGPGITRSDLLVINKIDLAPLVGANLGVIEADTLRMRAKRLFVFTNLKSGEGVDQIAKFVHREGRTSKGVRYLD